MNECATTGDCDLLGTNKTICKLYLVGNLQKCVTPNLCQQRCKDKAVCGLDGRCVSQGKTNTTNNKFNFFFLVLCSSNRDCATVRANPTCKQYITDGARTCKPPSSCPNACNEDQFCSAENTCEDWRQDKCATAQDCKHQHIVNTTCLDLGTHRVCVRPEECRSNCSEKQMCDVSKRHCLTPGKRGLDHSLTIVLLLLEPCISNSDCGDTEDKPYCRQFSKGSKKTCQSSSPCRETCTTEQFCNKDGICLGGDPEDGKDVVTTKGPDPGATCIFPFTLNSTVYRDCVRVRKNFEGSDFINRL